MPALPIDTDQIVITASRAPEQADGTPASVTIIDRERIERLDEPLVLALLRLTPSAAVTSIGPAGSLTEVRIRGSEANHSLFFSTESRSTIPHPATRRGSSCSTPTLLRVSRSCAGRNPLCGVRTRSAA